jgi:hypothetical protein
MLETPGRQSEEVEQHLKQLQMQMPHLEIKFKSKRKGDTLNQSSLQKLQ